MPYDVLEPETPGYDVIEPETAGYDVIEPDPEAVKTLWQPPSPTMSSESLVTGVPENPDTAPRSFVSGQIGETPTKTAPTSTWKQFFPALFGMSDEQRKNSETVRAAWDAGKASGLTVQEMARNAQQISDKWDAIIAEARESRPENVKKFMAERDAEMRAAGAEPLHMDQGTEIPKLSEDDVHTLFPGMGKRAVNAIRVGQNVVAGTAEGFMTPEGMALAVPGLGPQIGRAFVAQMGLSIPIKLSEAAGAYSAGDTEAGDAALIEAGGTAAMLGIPIAAAKLKKGKNSPAEEPGYEVIEPEIPPPSGQPRVEKVATEPTSSEIQPEISTRPEMSTSPVTGEPGTPVESELTKLPTRGRAPPAPEISSGTEGAMGFPMESPVPPIPAPAPAPGVTMIQHGRLPVTLSRTGEGSVSVPQIMQSLEGVQRVAGSMAGNIRTGRFFQKAYGIFKPHEEIIRMADADNIPTATHEVGHALQQQLYGTAKAVGLRTLPFDVRRELQGMGKALYGSRKPVAGYTGEGFAEFMRYWITTEDAPKVAPHTTEFFEQQVLPKYPEVAASLKQARGLVDVWRAQGSVERARRQVMREPGAFSRMFKALGGLVSYQAELESGAPLEALSKAAARKLGRPLPPSKDPYLLYSFKRSSAGATVERMAMNNMLDIWGNPVGPSLAEALAPVKGQRNEFMLYVYSKAAEMRWRQGKNPGISLEDAQHIKALYDSPKFQIAAQKYADWNNGLLNYVVQADPTMADAVAAMRGANDFYAPLSRMIDPAKATRLAAQARGNPMMRMHGSGLPVKDIFDQTFLNAAKLVNRAHRAMVTNAVVKTAAIQGLGHLIEEIPRSIVLEKVNIEKVREQLESLGVDTSAASPDTVLEYYAMADMPKGSAPIVAVKQVDGVHWYEVDPRLYDSLEGLQTFSLKNAFPNLPAVGVGLDLMLAAPARVFRLGTTGLRAAFSIITNPTRDLASAMVQTTVNPARFAAEYPAALAGVLREGFGGKGTPSTEAFYNLGAHMGQPLGIDISHTKRVSNELFHGRILRVALNPIDHLRQLFSITEAAPRVAELSAVAREVGWTPGTPMTPDQAVQMGLAAKRITVDFSAAGDVSRIVNAVVPFYNPAVQGMRVAARTMRSHPGRTVLLGLAAFTVPALVNWWKNKDEEWYRALPWRERYTYTNVDDGKTVWRIPRPFEWGNMFQVLPEAIFDSWYRQDPEAVKEAVGHIFATQNPLDWPVLARVAKEQWQNRIAFWDRPIVPRSELDLPAAMQVGPYTSQLAVAINRAFPNVSPRRVDAALTAYFGGVARDVIGGLGLGSGQIDREWELSDLPVFGVLARRGGHFNAQNQNISDFYDAYIPAKAKVDALSIQAKRQATGQPIGNALEVTATDMLIAGIGADASKAISVLVQTANSTKESQARERLYQAANDIAVRALTVMKKAGQR